MENKTRNIGVSVFGIRAPIIKNGDNIIDVVTSSLYKILDEDHITLNNKDVLTITESVVARSQGNYATIYDIRDDLISKFNKEEFGVIFPILSRNRFGILLKGMALSTKKIYLMLNYPSDEVGNHLISLNDLDNHDINPYTTSLTLEEFRKYFPTSVHEFTGIDYIEYYTSLIKECGCDVEIIFSNNPLDILKFTKNVLNCDIHTRLRSKNLLLKHGASKVYSMDDILTSSINNSGYNDKYGLLGSNKSTEDTIKLFPRDCFTLVNEIKEKVRKDRNVDIEVMVYGDGAFKDPQGKIWELADPVVSPGFTDGLKGTPNELKLKYLADNDFKDLKGDELKERIKERIKEKENNLKGKMESQGTTPRQITDLLGSLSDLTSGSGDKGTPFILIKGYFDNYSN